MEHVPFRDSKLTRILEPSLKGNAVVSVVCTMNGGPQFVEESISTLQFAKSVKKVRTSASKGETLGQDAVLRRYQEEIQELRRELEERNREEEWRLDSTPRKSDPQSSIADEQELLAVKERLGQLTRLILNSKSESRRSQVSFCMRRFLHITI